MNAPAMPPAPAPIIARSKTVRVFISDWVLGLFFAAGLSQVSNWLAGGFDWVSIEIEVDRKLEACFRIWGIVGFFWVRREDLGIEFEDRRTVLR